MKCLMIGIAALAAIQFAAAADVNDLLTVQEILHSQPEFRELVAAIDGKDIDQHGVRTGVTPGNHIVAVVVQPIPQWHSVEHAMRMAALKSVRAILKSDELNEALQVGLSWFVDADTFAKAKDISLAQGCHVRLSKRLLASDNHNVMAVAAASVNSLARSQAPEIWCRYLVLRSRDLWRFAVQQCRDFTDVADAIQFVVLLVGRLAPLAFLSWLTRHSLCRNVKLILLFLGKGLVMRTLALIAIGLVCAAICATCSGAPPSEAAVSGSNLIEAAEKATAQSFASGVDGCTVIRCSSGEGIVSTGSAGYLAVNDATITRLRMHEAYLKAEANAKRSLAIHFRGSTNSSRSTSSEGARSELGGEPSARGFASRDEEAQESLSAALTRATVFKIAVDDTRSRVQVSIITSPKIRDAVHLSSNCVDAPSLELAIQDLLKQLNSQVLPLSGNRIVNVSGRGIAVIGYGCSVVRSSTNPGLDGILENDARRISETRARSSLVKFLSGESLDWKSSFKESTGESYSVVDGDSSTSNAKKLRELESTFKAVSQSRETMSFVSQGAVPPGTLQQTFIRHGYCFSMSIWQQQLQSLAEDGLDPRRPNDRNGRTPARIEAFPRGQLDRPSDL